MLNLRRLKAERIAKGYTQPQMADMLGWKSRSQYAKRENGIVPMGADELMRIASILGFTKEELGIFFEMNVPEREQNTDNK